MATLHELDEEAWNGWVGTRPEAVQRLCRQLPPNRLYLLKTTGHRVTIYSYSEDDTVTVVVSGEYNAVKFARRVFGIRPDELEECDLPPPDEPLGAELTDPKDIEAFCANLRNARN